MEHVVVGLVAPLGHAEVGREVRVPEVHEEHAARRVAVVADLVLPGVVEDDGVELAVARVPTRLCRHHVYERLAFAVLLYQPTGGLDLGQLGHQATVTAVAATSTTARTMSGARPCNTSTGDISQCGQHIYEKVKLIGTPGKVYSYNSNHLQLAAAMAVAMDPWLRSHFECRTR